MKNNKGTTLLELMVSVAIFSSIMLVVTGVFANVNTAQREVIASQNIQESVRFFMEVMSKEIRMAKGDGINGVQFHCNNLAVSVNTAKKTYDFHDVNNNVLYFLNKDDKCVFYKLENDRIQISRDDGASFLPITPDSIKVSNLKFNVDDDDFGPPRTKQSKVTISFDVESKIDIEMHKNKTKIQTTISSRRYE